jgi:hypothetical protein
LSKLFSKVKEKYPKIEIKDLSVNPGVPEHIFVNVLADYSDDELIELGHFSTEFEIDILLDYGYSISIMADNPNLINV